MNKVHALVAVLSVLAVGIAGDAYGQGRGAGSGKRAMAPGKSILLSIPDLSEEQRQKVQDLRAQTQQQAVPIREQIAAIRKTIHTLWVAEKLDLQTISNKQGEMESLRGRMRNVWNDFFFKLHDVLTAGQRSWVAQQGHGIAAMELGMGSAPGPAAGCPCAGQ